eukprot:GSMAST32.ASY1.ANO1.1666.1 assembled CDS
MVEETDFSIDLLNSEKILSQSIRTIDEVVSVPGLITTKPMKKLRSTLTYFMQEYDKEKSSSMSNRISVALRDGCHRDAITLLSKMRSEKHQPKLSSVQRWVRDVMNEDKFASLDNKDAVSLLYNICCLQPLSWWWIEQKNQENQNKNKENQVVQKKCHKLIEWFPSFAAEPRGKPIPSDPHDIADIHAFELDVTLNIYTGKYGTRERENLCVMSASHYANAFKVVYKENGGDRRPRNRYALTIYQSIESIITYDIDLDKPNCSKQIRTDVPNVPGAFVISNILSLNECNQIIAAAEGSPDGYVPDEPLTSAPPPPGYTPRARSFIWLTDQLSEKMFARCRRFLPQTVGDSTLPMTQGLNARLRLYRYHPGAIYRPHVDGSWPGSGIRMMNKNYEYDIFGDRWSRFTFLVYLNDDFEGGTTNFYTPSPNENIMEGRRVEPRVGSVLIFPHGGSVGSIVHEGSAVTKGAKYVIRTDILYLIPGHTRKVWGENNE